MSEGRIVTIAMLMLIVAVALAALALLGPQLSDLIHLPQGVLR